eukprot:8935700-Karenia_brevis.AAC.1
MATFCVQASSWLLLPTTSVDVMTKRGFEMMSSEMLADALTTDCNVEKLLHCHRCASGTRLHYRYDKSNS